MKQLILKVVSWIEELDNKRMRKTYTLSDAGYCKSCKINCAAYDVCNKSFYDEMGWDILHKESLLCRKLYPNCKFGQCLIKK